MRYHTSQRFDREYAELPESLQKKIKKQVRLLVENLRHPSLRAKKYHEADGTWQARIDRRYRFYFKIEHDGYILITIKRHAD